MKEDFTPQMQFSQIVLREEVGKPDAQRYIGT